jgi:hypothetical protein
VVDDAELELAPAVRSRREALVQGDLGIRLIGRAEDPEFAGRDLGREDLDLRAGRRRDEAGRRGCDQQEPLDHPIRPDRRPHAGVVLAA